MTSQQPKKRDSSNDANRKPNKEMQRVYLRRRIVVVIVALVLVALIGFGVYALVTKASAAHGHDGQAASSSAASNAHKKDGSKKANKSADKKSDDSKSGKSDKDNKDSKANQSGVKQCGEKDVKLELTPASQSVGLGGSLDFKATIRYEGSDSCLIDASNASRILTISSVSGSSSDADSSDKSGGQSGSDSKTGSGAQSGSNSGSDSQAGAASGSDTVWSSAACPANTRKLLMAKGDKDVQKITWPTDKTGSTCVPDQQLPRVKRGTYMAQLSLKDHPEVKSEKVPVTVQ